jgi:hypothetical protein
MTLYNGLSLSLLGLTLALPPQSSKDFLCINLQGHANQKLDKSFHGSANEANHLGQLPRGRQELDDVVFEIGESMIQLGSIYIKDKPDAVKGIPVNRAFERLHVLQASGCSFSETNTVIGFYEL